ncbi:MAG: hypothetical protein PHF70_15455 [Opitutales bacterium]|nr:hypothetical protein [Opitutales bacterium]
MKTPTSRLSNIQAAIRRAHTPGHRGCIIHTDRKHKASRLACRKSHNSSTCP